MAEWSKKKAIAAITTLEDPFASVMKQSVKKTGMANSIKKKLLMGKK